MIIFWGVSDTGCCYVNAVKISQSLNFVACHDTLLINFRHKVLNLEEVLLNPCFQSCILCVAMLKKLLLHNRLSYKVTDTFLSLEQILTS